MDYSPILERDVGNYLRIDDPVSGEAVDHWYAKRRRWGMYSGETSFPVVNERQNRSGGTPRTLDMLNIDPRRVWPIPGSSSKHEGHGRNRHMGQR